MSFLKNTKTTHLQIGSGLSISPGKFNKFASLIADDVEPLGERGPPSVSPINTSVLPF